MECGLKQIIKEIIFGQTGHWYIDLCVPEHTHVTLCSSWLPFIY